MRETALTRLIPLAEATSPNEVGCKAFALAELIRHGFRVPEAWVLPTDSQSIPGAWILEDLGGCVAVRSSATAEDLADASFAGQFQSFLNIRSAEALEQAIDAVRASARHEAVRTYCSARGIDPATVRMAVLVQRMVPAEVAGVLFTVHPVSGKENEMLIEACPGVADELLAGRISGVPIPIIDGKPTRAGDLLTHTQIDTLVRLGRTIQRLKGAPQDIEWAIEGDDVYILQARPITKLCFGGIDGEWTNADFRDGGVSSEVVTPLMWSLYEFIWERALKGFLGELKMLQGDFAASHVFFGRPYWNLGAVKQCAMKLPGFVEREFDLDLAVKPRYDGDGARTPATLWNMLKAIPTVLAASRAFSTQEARDQEIMGRHPVEPDPRAWTDAEFRHRFRNLIENDYVTVEENYFRTIFCTSIAKLDFKTAMEGVNASYASLVGGLDALSYFECAQAMWALANRGEGSIEQILDRFGYHGRRELDLRVPRWNEEPELIVSTIQSLKGTVSPEELNRRQRSQFLGELARALSLLPRRRRKGFRNKLERLRRFLWLREQMRDLSTRMYALIRGAATEMGRRAAAKGNLRVPEDVHYLTFLEATDALSVNATDRVDARREHEEMVRHFRPPNEVGRGHALEEPQPSRGRLSGIGCSTGQVCGRARVVTRLEDAGKLQRGDILVCPFTDPGWTPTLNLAAGVVTENGGLLSHAAVICREYGIPAVLNVPGATRILRDGQTVRVDGDTGHVDVVR